MFKKNDADYVKACELCEHCYTLNMTGENICRYNNRLVYVEKSHSCNNFSYDLMTLKPEKEKLKAVEFAEI